MDVDDTESSEPIPNRVMERDQTELQEEDSAEETYLRELKHCSVLLGRLQPDDKAVKTELEDREEMSRKGGKLVSRIPTFQKRPTSTSQIPELPGPKKDSHVLAAPPAEKAGSESVEASKSQPPEVKEPALPPPSVRVPKVGVDVPSMVSSAEPPSATAAPSSTMTTPKSWGLPESVQCPLMTASPRPALRPDLDTSEIPRAEADAIPDAPPSFLPCQGSVSEKPQKQMKIILTAAGDAETSTKNFHSTEISQVEAIMDEEPPWETEPMKMAELKDSRSSSDAESEDDSDHEEADRNTSEQVEEHREPLIKQSEFPNLTKKKANVDESTSHMEEPLKESSATSARRSGCSSFSLCCLLPTILLLLGGSGQHIWHYGLPLSVSQLSAQLELHWLEGFSFGPEPCSRDCRIQLVESIPVGLYKSSPSSRPSIADSWLHLLDKANSSVHIAAFYFTLQGGDLESADPADSQGRRVFEQLKQLESKGVQLQIAVNAPQTSTQDTVELAATGADIREVDLKAVTGGIIHTKMWVVDQKHFYLGSANMDWRSLSQVKEVGLSVEDCSCLAQDAFRIFGVYWSIGGVNNASLPPYWPARLSALSSSEKPLHLKFNGVPAQVYLSSAPPQISARGRSDDLSTILSVISDAQKFVYISVMDYLPLSEFTKPLRFWPAIDSRLRAAACTRGVQVRLMVSCWDHSPASMFVFLQSLLVLSRPPLHCNIEVKVFTVPSTAEQKKIPFARVNHAKYMVTDRVVYIGTSNWSENYFTHTAGVGLVVNQTGSVVDEGQQTLQSQTEELFLRDWNSEYASTLSAADVDVCPHSPR
ncbi:5'-3' exonuclease PLD3 isoform X2 [Melanotaenia boesemani]|uniref:5'-3' exonuclease PLD3 isoform X2 n=1 Tax=Melanotaenia boesemani TaxID=1250792 RepID=UPI001C03C9CB|nr:5'-3' exonuclease PLD3 isoform X2 [Melanotaenia boesemani]